MPHASLADPVPSRRGVSKAVMVYDQLRSDIVSLALKPGIRIDKNKVCARLHVSRQPVADALSRLAEERLVEVEPQKGTFVARVRMASVLEAAFLRRALEIATVERVAADIDDATLQPLERNLAYQATALEADDIDGFYALDLRFHAMLFERLGMERLAEAVGASRAQLERARRLLLPLPSRNRATLREHRAIVAALAARDPRAATRAMAAHLDAGMSELKRFAARQPELFESQRRPRGRNGVTATTAVGKGRNQL